MERQKCQETRYNRVSVYVGGGGVGAVAKRQLVATKLSINNFELNFRRYKTIFPPTSTFIVIPPRSTNLCQQVCAWLELLEKRPPFLNLRLIQGTFLLKCTNLLNFPIFYQKIALHLAITKLKF